MWRRRGRRRSGDLAMGSRLVAAFLSTLPLLEAVAAAAPKEEGSPIPVEIGWSLRTPSSLPVAGTVVFTPEVGASEPIRVLVSSQSPVRLELGAESTWEVSAEIPGFWVRRKNLVVGRDPAHLELELWPLGTVSGTLSVRDKSLPKPQKILVKTLSAPAHFRRPQAPPGAMECPLDEKGSWSCALPAATYDLALSAQGLIPHYRWGVEVKAGKESKLGNFELQRGGSLSAWVAVEGGDIEPGRCIARLVPRTSSQGDIAETVTLSRTAVEREVTRDGFLQLTGLAPGVYSLEVQQPGFAPVRAELVRVEREAETFLRTPLVLRRPLQLEFSIDPPLDWLGKPWQATVSRRDPAERIARIVFEGAADTEGRFSVPGQTTGRFGVHIIDSLGNKLYTAAETGVDGPATAVQQIEIDILDVEGTIVLGDKPLPAALRFQGAGAVSVKLEADAEGHFFGVLPDGGRWLVEVEAAEPRLRTRVWAEVRASRSGKARLDIELPDTRVFGRVVDENGKPAPGARIVALGESIEQFAEADGEGLFELRALPEGFAWMGAEAASRVSDRVGVTLSEGLEVGAIELRLRAVEKLGGAVTSRLGPVAGALVEIMTPAPEGGDSATSGLDGTFNVEVPKGARQAVAVVAAPGFALRTFKVALEGQPIAFQVSEEGGTLEVVFSDRAVETLQRDNLGFVVRQNGLPILPGTLERWAQDLGEGRSATEKALRFPNLAPGEYRACFVPRQLPFLASEEVLAAAGARCDAGTLSAGGTLSLKPVR